MKPEDTQDEVLFEGTYKELWNTWADLEGRIRVTRVKEPEPMSLEEEVREELAKYNSLASFCDGTMVLMRVLEKRFKKLEHK